MKVTRVLIVDDSVLMRRLLTRILEADPEIEVCGTASDPYQARKKIKQLNPDVLTLDVDMPAMDGITFLRNLMRLHPMPVVMISSFTERGAAVALQALELGALDFICKPGVDHEGGLESYSEEIIGKLKAAAGAWLHTVDSSQTQQMRGETTCPDDAGGGQDHTRGDSIAAESLVAVGASTGGTEAIKVFLQKLPPYAPGVVITQHIPEAFSRQFAQRLNRTCSQTVCQAEDGQPIQHGCVYIAPGNRHLAVARKGDGYQCILSDGPRVNHHMPSVDVLFRSVARSAGASAIGVLLTGMGKDGAQGMLEMQNAGACTIAQDEKSSVIWGMPGAAFKLGAVDSVLPLGNIADRIRSLLFLDCHSRRNYCRTAR